MEARKHKKPLKPKDIVNSVVRYFDLFSNHPETDAVAHTKGEGTQPPDSGGWLLALFIAVFLGVVAKGFVDAFDFKTNTLGPGFLSLRLVVSLIVTGVIFPAVYKQTLDKSTLPGAVQLCLAFGGGFGYKALIDIGK
jgi:hypothetical protein